MTLSYTYAGSALTHNVVPSGSSLTSLADGGESAFASIIVEDPNADLAIVGHKTFIVEESACTQPRLWTGWVTERAIGRSIDRGMFVGANARLAEVTLVDLNAAVGFRLITGSDGNRKAETWNARLAWILGSSYLSGLVANDTTYCASSTMGMDETDYRGQYPGQVISDLNDRAGGSLNWFIFWDPATQQNMLFLKAMSEATNSSTLTISNNPADHSATCFPPDAEARLHRTPDETWSGVMVEYSGGRVVRRRASTVTNYTRRETSISRPHTKSKDTAISQAEKFLDAHANEEDRIDVTIVVPRASAGLVMAGQRLQVKFTHLPGYTSFTWMRVVSCTPTPLDDTARYYSIALELAQTRPVTAATGPTCSYVAATEEHATSADIFGATLTASLEYTPPVNPLTCVLWGVEGFNYANDPLVTYGEVNSGDLPGGGTGSFGVLPDVSGTGQTIISTYTYDFDEYGSPPICTILLGRVGGFIEAQDVYVAGSNGGAWTTLLYPDDVLAMNGTAGYYYFDAPYPTYRYWRITVVQEMPPGLNYYGGIDWYYHMFWPATGGDPADEVVDLGEAPSPTPTPPGPTPLLADGHGVPFTFDDLLQNDAGDDFVYPD